MSLKTKRLFFGAFASRPRPSYTQILRPDETYYEKDKVQDLLSKRAVNEISTKDLQFVLSSNIAILSPIAYLYYLPAFLELTLSSIDSTSLFADGLIRSLTKPESDDSEKVLETVDALESIRGRQSEITELIRNQQPKLDMQDWRNSIFHKRFDNVLQLEGEAILFYLEAFDNEHGKNYYPFDEVKIAIDRHWKMYRSEK